jgi:fructoselysine-6-P-deglycase FrlB-like protein
MLNEIMLQEIQDQPQAMAESLPALRSQLAAMDPALLATLRFIFTGSGDSYLAPLALKWAAMLHLSSEVHVVPALEAARYWPFRPTDLLVPISISGEAVRTAEAAASATQAQTRVLSITANPTSSLARASTASLIIPFHSRSRKTPHTTDYMTTLVALAALFEAAGKRRIELLDGLADTVGTVLGQLRDPCEAFARAIAGREHLYLLGGGPNRATAGYAAAKFWEAGGLRAFDFDAEEFAHGPHFLVNAGDPVLIIAPGSRGVARGRQLVDGLQHLEARAAVITDQPEPFSGVTTFAIPAVPDEWSPFFTALPLQLLCWAVSNEKGYDVVRKDGHIQNPEAYEKAHFSWVRANPAA